MAYRKSRGRPQLPNISLFIADMLFSILTQVFFLLQVSTYKDKRAVNVKKRTQTLTVNKEVYWQH